MYNESESEQSLCDKSFGEDSERDDVSASEDGKSSAIGSNDDSGGDQSTQGDESGQGEGAQGAVRRTTQRHGRE